MHGALHPKFRIAEAPSGSAEAPGSGDVANSHIPQEGIGVSAGKHVDAPMGDRGGARN